MRDTADARAARGLGGLAYGREAGRVVGGGDRLGTRPSGGFGQRAEHLRRADILAALEVRDVHRVHVGVAHGRRHRGDRRVRADGRGALADLVEVERHAVAGAGRRDIGEHRFDAGGAVARAEPAAQVAALVGGGRVEQEGMDLQVHRSTGGRNGALEVVQPDAAPRADGVVPDLDRHRCRRLRRRCRLRRLHVLARYHVRLLARRLPNRLLALPTALDHEKGEQRDESGRALPHGSP